jgi:outer membrane putative beta-barrel porin/alpha-amylase
MPVAARLCLIVLSLASPAAWCGPPFATDDPAVLEGGQMELLPFHQSTLTGSGRGGVLAGVEAHFGVAKNLEVDATASLAFARPFGERTHAGYGDTTLAFKYKLVDEAPGRPLVSLVPRINVATGSARRGLGNGGTQIFLAASLQRNFEPFQTYVTAGYWLNRGASNRDYASAGWVVQRDFGRRWTLGIELFANGAASASQPPSIGFNAGGAYKRDAHGQWLFSAGRGIVHAAQNNRFSTYLGYLQAF